jgi:ribokinase
LVEVIGVGALNWDRLILVDRFARAGEEIVIKGVKEAAGGSSANTLSALGRLGIECGFIGKIGSDEEAGLILDAFKQDGVDINGITTSEGKSGSVFAFVDEEGERSMYVNPGVNESLLVKDLDIAYMRSARIIHISSFAGERSLETIKKIPEMKGESKLTFAPGFLSSRGIDFLRPILEVCEILFLNEEEAFSLTRKSPRDAGIFLRSLGVKEVVITLGKRGCATVDEEGTKVVRGVDGEVADTTGAGDAFAAGFLYGELQGFGAQISSKIGHFVASRCIQRVGAREGLPDKRAIDTFLGKNQWIKRA